MKSVALAEPILVGRKQELDQLNRCLELSTQGKGMTILISGEAGSGKTRLTAEFLASAKKEGVMVLAGWCLSNAAQPYFPFVEAFESHFSAVSSGLVQQQELKSWFVGNSQAEEQQITHQLWKDRTFAAITKELVHMSISRSIILFIDDLHWADSASLALLHYIARSITSEKILLLATFRTEEISVKINGRTHPLAEVLRLMAREELFKEISLRDLSQSDVGRIAMDMLKGDLDSEFAERLSQESHGNPLFVVEALRMMYSQGSLVQEQGRWHIRSGSIEIPSKVKDVILRRLDTLKPNERRILDAASVMGEKFDPKLVSDVLSQDNIEILESLNTVAQNTLLVFCEGNNYQFKHAKIREMLYEVIPLILKKEYHSRIAEKMEASIHDLVDVAASDLAYHYSRAENREKAIKYALIAGKDELAKWSNTQAIKHLTYALEAIGEDPRHVEERESALSSLASAFYADSLYKDAERTFEKLANITLKNAVKLRALIMAAYSAFSLGDILKLTELSKKAEQYSASNRLENARVLTLKGRVFTLQKNPVASIECNKAALEAFEEEYSLPDAAICLLSLGGEGVVTGKLDRLADSLLAVALFGELGAFNQQMIACYLAGNSFSNCLLLPEALNMYAKVAEIYERTKVGNYSALALGYAFSSQIFECLGDLQKALDSSFKALEASKKTDSSVDCGVIFWNLATQYARLGNTEHSEEYIKKLMDLPLQIRSHFFVHPLLAKAALSASKNLWQESNQYFSEFLAPLDSLSGHYWEKFYASQLYAWALQRQGSIDKSRVKLEQTKKMKQETEERFEHANVKVKWFLNKYSTAVGVESEIRLYLINLARKPGTLVRVDGLIPLGCKVNSLPSFCSPENDSIELNKKVITTFKVENITISLKFKKAGVYTLKPILVYENELGEVRRSIFRPITFTVELTSEHKLESGQEPLSRKLDFKSEATEKAFTFLVSAFEEDYVKRKLPQEKSGWRTLMEVVKNAPVSKHSMYGQSGRGGEVPAELGQLGLVESRFFSGERGRGGRVLKTRIRQY